MSGTNDQYSEVSSHRSEEMLAKRKCPLQKKNPKRDGWAQNQHARRGSSWLHISKEGGLEPSRRNLTFHRHPAIGQGSSLRAMSPYRREASSKCVSSIRRHTTSPWVSLSSNRVPPHLFFRKHEGRISRRVSSHTSLKNRIYLTKYVNIY